MTLDEFGSIDLHIHNGIALHEEISHRNIWELPNTGKGNHLMLFSFAIFKGENFTHFIFIRRSDRGSPKRVLK